MNVAHIINNTSKEIMVSIDGKAYNIAKDHLHYNEIKDRLCTRKYDDLLSLVNIPEYLQKTTNGKVYFNGSQIYWNGHVVDNYIVDRIIQFSKEGSPFESLLLFLENMLKNPDKSVIEYLYTFLEYGNMPITDDGCFLAYKKVDNEYRSYHASPDGTYLKHPIGGVVSMNREKVNSNRSETCSTGLHFCSLSYLSQYSGGKGRVLILKINPRDVCAIPHDYNNTKGRACCYEIFGEYVSDTKEKEPAFKTAYVDKEAVKNSQIVTSPFYNVRDSKGKFCKRK